MLSQWWRMRARWYTRWLKQNTQLQAGPVDLVGLKKNPTFSVEDNYTTVKCAKGSIPLSDHTLSVIAHLH